MRIFLYYKNISGFINILKREIDTLSDYGLLIHDLFLRRRGWRSGSFMSFVYSMSLPVTGCTTVLEKCCLVQ
jgi:hypothetical protein